MPLRNVSLRNKRNKKKTCYLSIGALVLNYMTHSQAIFGGNSNESYEVSLSCRAIYYVYKSVLTFQL